MPKLPETVQRAVLALGAEAAQVVGHGHDPDGRLIVLVDYGIKGTKKFYFDEAELPELPTQGRKESEDAKEDAKPAPKRPSPARPKTTRRTPTKKA